jgi:hypothetical protein
MYVKPGSDTYLTFMLTTNSLEIFRNQIILFALILKVITSICNETIFHLIVKSTLAKLCRVGIVYLIFLLTEMKCVWERYFKAVNQLSWQVFSSSYLP